MPRCTHTCPTENRSRNTLCLFVFHRPDYNWKHKDSAVGTTPRKAVQHVFVPSKLGAGGIISLCSFYTQWGKIGGSRGQVLSPK